MQRPESDFGVIEAMMLHGLAFEGILACVRIHAFDDFDGAPVRAVDFAKRYGLLAGPAQGLLGMLAAYGVLEQTGSGYRNTRLASEHLVSTSTFYQGAALELHDRFNADLRSDLLAYLAGGPAARERSDDNWALREGLKGSAQQARLGALQDTVDCIAALPGFMDMRVLCDIGGSHGEYAMELMALNPDLRGDIADLPEVAAMARHCIQRRGFGERLAAVPCDLRRERLPEGAYDLILSSHVLYAFMDDLTGHLTMVRAALKPGGWFVSHHLDPEGGLAGECAATVEFTTRLSGYATHFIGREMLERSLAKAGFAAFRTAPAGPNGCGLILAAQNPE